LLKQNPQKEVLESKPSTASSDEEKLTTGISTIELKAKRQGSSWKQWGCEETPLRLQHTIPRKATTQAAVGIKMAIAHRLPPDINLDRKVYIVPPLTTRIPWEMTGGESWKI
jgi:hypothetical protein